MSAMAHSQFGIVLIPFQLTDATGPLDVLSSSSTEYLRVMSKVLNLSEEFCSRGTKMEFHYVGETMEPVVCTANCRIQPTVTIENCPKLDYLLIGGPSPEYLKNIPPNMAQFIKDKAAEVNTVFTTCTGGLVAGMLGLLDGRNATTNHQLVPMAKQIRPQVNWTSEQQWVVDGKWWTAGGACAGMDMFAHWVAIKYGRDVAEVGWSALDYEPRDVNGKRVPLKVGLCV